MFDFWEEWVPGAVVVGLLVLMIWAIAGVSKGIDQKCEKIMTFARTPKDSMDATIACERLHSDFSRDMAIAAAAGAASSAAASRSYGGR